MAISQGEQIVRAVEHDTPFLNASFTQTADCNCCPDEYCQTTMDLGCSIGVGCCFNRRHGYVGNMVPTPSGEISNGLQISWLPLFRVVGQRHKIRWIRRPSIWSGFPGTCEGAATYPRPVSRLPRREISWVFSRRTRRRRGIATPQAGTSERAGHCYPSNPRSEDQITGHPGPTQPGASGQWS